MVKADGCVAIHADGGAYKPLNWMNAPEPARSRTTGAWTVTNPKGETLTHHASTRCCRDRAHELGVDPGLQKDGVEAHLQELLAANCHHARRRACAWCAASTPPTSARSTCCAATPTARAVAVEIKRRGEIDGVEQLTRYLEFLNRDPMLRPVRGMFVAQQVKPQAKVLAADRGIAWRRGRLRRAARHRVRRAPAVLRAM